MVLSFAKQLWPLSLSILVINCWSIQVRAQTPEASAIGADESGEITQEISFPLMLEYKHRPWNRSSKKIDTGVLWLRDKKLNKTVRLTLSEDQKNSNHFVGQFFIRWETPSFEPEVFVSAAPYNNKKRRRSKDFTMAELIEQGVLKSKPYLLRRIRSKQKLTLFDTQEELVKAYKTLQAPAIVVPVDKPAVDPVALEAARRAAVLAEQKRLADLAKAQETLRLKKEEEARLQAERRRQEQERLSKIERQKRIAEAKELSRLALEHYQNQRFVEAETNFRRSIELDPSEKSYYFQYGVTLYKNGKYDEALVAFKLANDPKVNPLEKAFYEGICHMKLKEYDPALQKFSEVSAADDKTLSPSATFFSGVIEFSRENYKPAKIAFEKTLDTSDDPQLDEQAENYIEQIATIEQYQAKLEKRFTANVSGGLMYDSNILLVSNASSSDATNKDGFRGLLNADLAFRMVYTEKHELSAELHYTDLYSVDTQGKPNAILQFADPIVMSAKVPYKWKGSLFGKGYLLSIAPGYETLGLNADGVGSRETTMLTTLVATQQTFLVSDSYVTTLRLDWRKEDSKLENVGTFDATKIILGSQNIWFKDSKKTEAFLFNFALTDNQSPADDNAFGKSEVALGYLMPVWSKTQWTNMLTGSVSDYPRSPLGRKDSNVNFNSSLSSPFNETLTGLFSLGLETNTSTIEAATYNKYTLMATLSWTTDF